MEVVRIALLSAWHVHFTDYATEFRANPNCKITAMWDEDPERGKELASQYECYFEEDLDVLLRRPDVDAVMVTAPTNIHKKIIVKAAKAGKHIYTEKVLALTEAECLEIKEAILEAGVKFVICFMRRLDGRVIFIKQLLDSGKLGDITFARVRNAHAGAIANWLPTRFYDKEQCGGGAMMDLGAHPMYLLLWLLGKPKSVVSMFNHVTGKEVEDNAVSVIEFANKAIGVSETGFVSLNSPFSIELAGTLGSLLYNGIDGQVRYNVGEGWVTPSTLPQNLERPVTQFVDGILNDKQTAFTVDEAVELTKLMEGAYLSHAQGRKIEL